MKSVPYSLKILSVCKENTIIAKENVNYAQSRIAFSVIKTIFKIVYCVLKTITYKLLQISVYLVIPLALPVLDLLNQNV